MSDRNTAGVGSFIRAFVNSLARTERVLSVWETRGAIVVPTAEDAAPKPEERIEPRRGGRLIDLERRAKFGQFGPTPR